MQDIEQVRAWLPEPKSLSLCPGYMFQEKLPHIFCSYVLGKLTLHSLHLSYFILYSGDLTHKVAGRIRCENLHQVLRTNSADTQRALIQHYMLSAFLLSPPISTKPSVFCSFQSSKATFATFLGICFPEHFFSPYTVCWNILFVAGSDFMLIVLFVSCKKCSALLLLYLEL